MATNKSTTKVPGLAAADETSLKLAQAAGICVAVRLAVEGGGDLPDAVGDALWAAETLIHEASASAATAWKAAGGRTEP